MSTLAATAAASPHAPWAIAVIVLVALLAAAFAYHGFRHPAPRGFGFGFYPALFSAAGAAGTCTLILLAVFSALHVL